MRRNRFTPCLKTDNCTPAGAERLKRMIEAYWLTQGEMVDVKLRTAPFVNEMRSDRVDIRSNMTNGMPRRIK